jgi:uncharacterized protein YciI
MPRLAAVLVLVAALQPALVPAGTRQLRVYHASLLRLGPNAAKTSPEERARLFAQHFAYRRALYEAGDILMYGPFDESSDPAFRGLSVFRGDRTLDEVRRLVAEDPYVKAGIMQADVMVWLTEPPRIEQGFGLREVDVPGR